MLIIMADENSDDWANTLPAQAPLWSADSKARLEDALDEFGQWVDFLCRFKHIPANVRAIPDEASFEQFMEKDALVGYRTVAFCWLGQGASGGHLGRYRLIPLGARIPRGQH